MSCRSRSAILLALVLVSCSDADDQQPPDASPADASANDATPADADPVDAASADGRSRDARPADATPADAASPPPGAGADVTAVTVSGQPGAYTFAVTLSSPDTGCAQYANWWEVVDANGTLLYRRILGHSHVDEQPFTRSGGPVAIEADTMVWVRGHMDPTGYGGVIMRGTPASGFGVAAQPNGWPDLARLDPQPTGCAF